MSNENEEEELVGGAEWLDVNGQPDYDYLRALAEDGGLEAMEELRGIADMHDIEYGLETSATDLATMILANLSQESGHESI